MADLFGDISANFFGYQVRSELGDQAAVLLGLEIAEFSGFLDGGYEHLVIALFRAGDHLAVVWGADFAGDFLAPRAGLVLDVGRGLGEGGVALGLEPGLADDLGL